MKTANLGILPTSVRLVSCISLLDGTAHDGHLANDAATIQPARRPSDANKNIPAARPEPTTNAAARPMAETAQSRRKDRHEPLMRAQEPLGARAAARLAPIQKAT